MMNEKDIRDKKGRFAKGCKINKGRKRSKEYIEKMRKTLKGRDVWNKRKIIRETDCWVWPYTTVSRGYGAFNNNGKRNLAHKAVYEFIKEKVKDGYELDHLCRNKMCVNPAHLEAVRHCVNVQRGSNVKLSVDDVRKIRKLKGKYSQKCIAKKFNVTSTCIGHIFQHKSWKNIK